jgi:hypothetical protein
MRCRASFPQRRHFTQSSRWELRYASVPSHYMNKKHSATAFWKIPLHDLARLPLERFVACIQATILQGVPQKNASHTGAFRAAIRRAQMFHLDFRTGNDIWGKRISRIRNSRRL